MIVTALLASVLSVSPSQDAAAPKTPAIARAVPKEAVFFLQATSLDALRADFEASSWHGFWLDEEMSGLRDSIEAKLKEAGEKEDELGVEPFEFLGSIHGSIGLFGMIEPGQPEPAMGLVVDPGEPRGAFEDAYAKILEKKKKDGTSSSSEYAGVELSLFEREQKPAAPHEKKDKDKHAEEDDAAAKEPEEPSESHTTYWALFDTGRWACAASAETREGLLGMVHGMIDRMSGKEASTGIEENDSFVQARSSAPSPGRVEAFVDVARILAMVQKADPPSEEADRVMKAIGIDDLRWVYASGDVGEGEAIGVNFAVRLPDSGYLREWIGFLGKLPRELAGMMPRASTSITLAQYDLWELWQSGWKLFREIDPDSAAGARAQLDATAQQIGGADIEKGFLAQLDGRIGSFNIQIPQDEWKATLGAAVELEESVQLPSVGSATILGLRDAAAVSKFLEGVLTATGMSAQIETEEFQGTTIHKFGMGGGPKFQWAFTKKAAVFSQFPTALRSALRMEGAESKDSALENESFKPLFETNKNAGVLGLANTADSLKAGLTALGLMGGMIGTRLAKAPHGEAGREMLDDNPLRHLPSHAAIERHFKGTLVSSVSQSGNVLHVRMYAR